MLDRSMIVPQKKETLQKQSLFSVCTVIVFSNPFGILISGLPHLQFFF